MRRWFRLARLLRPLRFSLPPLVGLALAAGGWATAAADGPVDAGAVPDEKTVGEPDAPGMMLLLQQEIIAGLKSRHIESNFARFRSYAGYMLNSTAGSRRTSEVTGNCRLSWYDHMLRNPLKAPIEAEAFTRQLHLSLSGDHRGFDRALVTAREKLDLGRRAPTEFVAVHSPEAALAVVKRALTGAQMGHAASLAPLTRSELGELTRNLYPVLVSENRLGHTLVHRGTGRRLCDLMEKMDRGGLHDAAQALVPLADPELLEQLAALPDDGRELIVAGVSGTVVRRMVTPAGTIVIGGRGPNTYQLNEMLDVGVVIDLGGDDVYHEGSVSIQRPVLVTIDLDGNDSYRGTKPGIQGGAILGIGMLIDAAGNDVYQARDVGQASCLAGVGILIDFAGDDTYVGLRRVQGQAFCGLGILVDRGGNDRYHGALWTQGFGGPLGFGVLDDLDGKDHYYTGGLYLDDYDETPGYDGWGQGVGAGPRSVANGGIGVILDGGGDDIYEFDYLSHGGGYWLGMGFARDFGGNDQRLGATRTTYSGGKRTQRSYQRFGNGFGCHYTLGFCFDDRGDDVYHGTIMGLGHAWDCSVGVLCDFGGNDRYESTGKTTQGNGSQAGLGILFDYNGDDYYQGYSQGNASRSISYHTLPQCGGNFSFVVDYGGKDEYGCRAKNNSFNRRGAAGGFLIDRPRKDEIEATEATKTETTKTEATKTEATKTAKTVSTKTTAKKK